MSDCQLKLPPHQGSNAMLPLLPVRGIGHSGQCSEANYVPFFTARGHDVYTLSLRGHGDDRSRLDQYVLDDQFSVLSQLDGKTVLMGHSMGGTLAQKAMSQASERIAAVVVQAPIVPG